MNMPIPAPTARTSDWGMARASHWRIPKIERKKKIHLHTGRTITNNAQQNSYSVFRVPRRIEECEFEDIRCIVHEARVNFQSVDGDGDKRDMALTLTFGVSVDEQMNDAPRDFQETSWPIEF